MSSGGGTEQGLSLKIVYVLSVLPQQCSVYPMKMKIHISHELGT